MAKKPAVKKPAAKKAAAKKAPAKKAAAKKEPAKVKDTKPMKEFKKRLKNVQDNSQVSHKGSMIPLYVKINLESNK